MSVTRLRRHPSYYPNTALRLLKWPVALLAILSLPLYLSALLSSPLWQLDFQALHRPLLGLLGYVSLWALIFRRRFMGSSFSTFEHELTHAVFAWLTLHRVVGLRVTWNQGGACMIEGDGAGNWAVAIAPYWFPTLLFPVLLVEAITHSSIAQYGVGVVMGYHLLSTWRELHPGQTDIQQTGFIFAWLFLPSANLAVYHSALTYAFFGTGEALSIALQPLGDVIGRVINLL